MFNMGSSKILSHLICDNCNNTYISDSLIIATFKSVFVCFSRTLTTVWHKNFTWNLILRFYDWWQNCNIKFCKLDGIY